MNETCESDAKCISIISKKEKKRGGKKNTFAFVDPAKSGGNINKMFPEKKERENGAEKGDLVPVDP